MFYSLLNKRSCVPCCNGSRIREKFELKIEPDGNRHLVKTGEEDLYEIIQSFEAQCTIENIVRRYENGDITALNRVQGMYIDASVLPTNLHEANKLLNSVRDVYYKLSVEDKKLYPTFDDFMSNFETLDSVNSFIRSRMPQKPPQSEKDVRGDNNVS